MARRSHDREQYGAAFAGRPLNPNRETFDALMAEDDGRVTFAAPTPMSDKPGFEGAIVPYYVLSDRGTYFVPGSFKKTAREQLKKAPVLWQHWDDEVIGRHEAADAEDPGAFRIAAAINEGVQRGAEALSNLRFGVALGLSVGIDRVADRSGTPADDAKLDRRTAPDYWKNVPINELRAVTEARWWESSLVTFAAIGTAKPDIVHSAGSTPAASLATLLAALKDGTATAEQLAALHELTAAYEAFTSAAAGSDHGTDDPSPARDRRTDAALAAAKLARLRVMELNA